MTWHEFGWFALPAVVLWLAAGTVVYTKVRRMADYLMLAGIGGFALFIVLFWVALERPPLRTMGETRLCIRSSSLLSVLLPINDGVTRGCCRSRLSSPQSSYASIFSNPKSTPRV